MDDILTTGASLLETVEAVRAAGVEPVAAAVLVDRSTEPVELGFPLHALGRIEIPSWEADACPLCAGGTPLRKPGSSKARPLKAVSEARRDVRFPDSGAESSPIAARGPQPFAPPVKLQAARCSDGTT